MNRKYSKDEDVIYGRKPVLEAFESDIQIEKVFINNQIKGTFEKEIRTKCREKVIPLAKVPQPKLNEISGTQNHQGIAAYTTPISYTSLENILPDIYNKGKPPLILILDGIKDVRNIGAIARSALAFDIDAMVCSVKNAGRISKETVKASAGAIMKIPICRESSILSAVEELQTMGIRVVASDLSTNTFIHEADLTGPLAIIMGSEEKGVDRNILSQVDEKIKIPQSDSIDSLNVSVASGILLYEVQRQRGLVNQKKTILS